MRKILQDDIKNTIFIGMGLYKKNGPAEAK